MSKEVTQTGTTYNLPGFWVHFFRRDQWRWFMWYLGGGALQTPIFMVGRGTPPGYKDPQAKRPFRRETLWAVEVTANVRGPDGCVWGQAHNTVKASLHDLNSLTQTSPGVFSKQAYLAVLSAQEQLAKLQESPTKPPEE